MNDDFLDFVRKTLPTGELALKEVSKKTGVPESTIKKIRLGFSKNPTYKNLMPLYLYCKEL